MSDDTYLLTAEEIAAMEGLRKAHFLNRNARRVNKSLGDATGLTKLGVHIIEVEPGCETTEFHRHYHEDEAVYVLSGTGTARIGDDRLPVRAGDFLGYRAGGVAHTIENTGTDLLRCLVMGQRADHDVADYPDQDKRIFRNIGVPWAIADMDDLVFPVAGAKK